MLLTLDVHRWYVTGDLHGQIGHLKDFEDKEGDAVILLGDAGFNYYLGKKDWKFKHNMSKKNCVFYVVRGNHEARPQDIKGMVSVYDPNVKGEIYVESEFPKIRYFKDGAEYDIGGYSILVIGGAYSVDCFYRLKMGWQWFANEQLSAQEKNDITNNVKGHKYDIVLTHTCPYSWRPTEFFLPSIDQSTVDNSTELWLEEIKDSIEWTVWLFGHYHKDLVVANHAMMLQESIEPLDGLWLDLALQKTPWYYPKSQHYFMEN